MGKMEGFVEADRLEDESRQLKGKVGVLVLNFRNRGPVVPTKGQEKQWGGF